MRKRRKPKSRKIRLFKAGSKNKLTPEQLAARDRVLAYLGDAAHVTPEEEAEIVAQWDKP